MTKTTDYGAANLYDGGWRADDKEQLMAEYDLTAGEADEICAELLDIENRNTYEEAKDEHREVEFDGKKYALTQDAYLCGGTFHLGTDKLRVWFQAEAIDPEGNRYLAVWRPIENWDPADDDEDIACDWHWPDLVKPL